MRVFITGGTGFLGKPLCATLQDHELLVLTRCATAGSPAISGDYLHGDLFDLAAWKQTVEAFRPEACLHLAWSDLPDFSLDVCQKNFQAGLKLFELLRDLRCSRIAVAGTCFEYGKLTGHVNEEQLPESPGLFAAFKSSQRTVGQSLLAGSQTALVWARPFFIYGPGQRATSLIPSVLRNLHSGLPLEIRTPGASQDFIHVDDVARGLALLATSPARPGIYNLGSGEPTRVRDLVNLIARELGRPDVYPTTDSVSSAATTAAASEGGFWANIDRVRAETGWSPEITLLAGFRRTIAAWKETA